MKDTYSRISVFLYNTLNNNKISFFDPIYHLQHQTIPALPLQCY